MFDVEGVLIPKNRLFFDVCRKLGAFPLLKMLFYGFLYEIGVLSLNLVLKRIFRIMRGTKTAFFAESFNKLPLMPKAREVFAELKAQGRKTALISSGIPAFLVEKLARDLDADHAVGVEVGLEGDILTGEVGGNVIENKGKLLVLKELMESEHIRPDECAIVGDDRNNTALFIEGTRKIGFNPDFVVRVKAEDVVNCQLTKILPIIKDEEKNRRLPSRNDYFRESIHASGIFVPVVAGFISVPLAVSLICLVIALYSISELGRVQGKSMPVISQITRIAASQSELCEFTVAPIYFAVGITLTLVLFPTPVNSAAIAIFALGDSTASLIGGTLTNKPLLLNKTKTLEGSISVFLFGFLAGALFVAPWLAFVGAATAMMVEYLPSPINDNLSIPLVTGFVLMLLTGFH